MNSETSTTSLDAAAPSIARSIVGLIEEHRTASPAVKRLIYVTLKWMMRELEKFVEPLVSVQAQETAKSMGVGDLRAFQWRDQHGRMKDPGRQIFYWEHAAQTSDMAKALLAVENPTEEAVAKIIRGAAVAWITREEAARLPRGARRDWRIAYLDAGIELCA